MVSGRRFIGSIRGVPMRMVDCSARRRRIGSIMGPESTRDKKRPLEHPFMAILLPGP
jgi:hypothetical protein